MASVTTLRLQQIEGSKLYDALVTIPVIMWFTLCLMNQIPSLIEDLGAVSSATLGPAVLTGLLARAAAVIFAVLWIVLLVVRRTPKAKAEGLLPRVAALAGGFLGIGIVLLPPHELSPTFNAISAALILAGTIFSIYAIIRLGRSVSIMAEARRLVTDGPYAVIRHPLYLGEAVALLGLTLQYLSAWALLLLGLQLAFQFLRMSNEEQVLSRTFPEYRAYMQRTARLIPGVY
jgi:protein-S-isoprenylcysteine O-methyltransferase Ste14